MASMHTGYLARPCQEKCLGALPLSLFIIQIFQAVFSTALPLRSAIQYFQTISDLQLLLYFVLYVINIPKLW